MKKSSAMDEAWNLRVTGGSLGAAVRQSRKARERGGTLPIFRLFVQTLVRVDQIFVPRRDLAVDRDGLEVQGFDQRYLAGVGTGEGGVQLGCNALLQPLHDGGSQLLQEGEDQPAADSPRHAETAVELDRTLAQSSIDVDLLV